MTNATAPASIAMVTEKAVRSAYKNISPKQRYRLQWSAPEAQERELLAFLHLAVIGLSDDELAEA